MADVVALILAAGRGSRIGGPKLWLPLGGSTFLEVICERLSAAGLERILAVVAPSTLELPVSIVRVVNPQPERGMLSSVAAGIQAAGEATGYLLIPVDHPFVQTDTLRALVAAFYSDSTKIVKPVYRGRGGHPIILPHDFAHRLPGSDVPGGLRSLIARAANPVLEVAVEDAGVLRNINEPRDLKSDSS